MLNAPLLKAIFELRYCFLFNHLHNQQRFAKALFKVTEFL